MIGGLRDIIMGEDGLVVRRKGQKGVVVFFVSTTEVRTTRLFYIYGSWVSKRILILRDRIPNSLTITQDP